MGYLEKAIEVADRLKKEKTKKLSEERQETFSMVMDATLRSTVIDIVKLGSTQWQPSPETHAAEEEIVRIQNDVLGGRGELIDFREACLKWKAAGRREG